MTRTISDSVQNGTPIIPQETKNRSESLLDDLLNDGKLSSLDRVKKYLEDLQKEDLSYAGLRAPERSPEAGARSPDIGIHSPDSRIRAPELGLRAPDLAPRLQDLHPPDVFLRPKSPINRSLSVNDSIRPLRPRSAFFPEPPQSEFDKYVSFKKSLERDRSARRPLNAYDRIKELHDYRRQVSQQQKAREEELKLQEANIQETKPSKEHIVKTSESSQKQNSTLEEAKSSGASKKPISASKTDIQLKENSERKVDTEIGCLQVQDPSTSQPQQNGFGDSSKTSVLEKYLNRETKPKKESRFLNKIRNQNQNKEESRVDKAIKSLRKFSVGVENEFSESKLLKRAVSLEELSVETPGRKVRSSSLKPEDTKMFRKKDSAKVKKGGVFDKIQAQGKPENGLKKNSDELQDRDDRTARIANLKKLDFNRMDVVSTESTPTGDFDEAQSFVSHSNSDTWSSSDLTDRYFDAGSGLGSAEENISERIRRKSFYHRFNTPKRYSYQRSASNMERKRYF